MHSVKILDIADVTHNVRRYTLEKPEGYSFKPGQATEVSLDEDGWRDKKHPFTFTALTDDPNLEFTIKSYFNTGGDGVTERLYGYTPEYLAPGPEFDPRYQVDDPEDHTPSREHIREDVVEVLKREPELDASGITVEVTDECDLILRGKVARIADKRLAADLVADVSGVRDVHNDIRVIRRR